MWTGGHRLWFANRWSTTVRPAEYLPTHHEGCLFDESRRCVGSDCGFVWQHDARRRLKIQASAISTRRFEMARGFETLLLHRGDRERSVSQPHAVDQDSW
jgi:hypothetical protein